MSWKPLGPTQRKWCEHEIILICKFLLVPPPNLKATKHTKTTLAISLYFVFHHLFFSYLGVIVRKLTNRYITILSLCQTKLKLIRDTCSTINIPVTCLFACFFNQSWIFSKFTSKYCKCWGLNTFCFPYQYKEKLLVVPK